MLYYLCARFATQAANARGPKAAMKAAGHTSIVRTNFPTGCLGLPDLWPQAKKKFLFGAAGGSACGAVAVAGGGVATLHNVLMKLRWRWRLDV